jgi:DNA-binding LacI/PurR family transcriptional regulator
VTRQLTIADVAARAGVSKATVSRAFSRPNLLSAAVADHVRRVADEIGYVPNRIARALSTGRFGVIALLVPDIANPFFPPLIRAAQARADAAGYAVLIGDSDETPDREDVLLSKMAVQVDGFVVASPRQAEARILHHASQKPTVLINRDIPEVTRVLMDVAGGITSALTHLVGLGHRRIAYVSGPAASWANQQRETAVAAAAQRLGVALQAVPAHRPTYEAGRAVVDELIRTGVTAVLAFDDLVAQGVVAGYQVRDIAIPGDVSVVGFDDVLAATTHPPLTTIAGHCADAGAAAVDLLIRMIDTGETTPSLLTIPTALVVRASTAGARPAARLAQTRAGGARRPGIRAAAPSRSPGPP